MMLRNMCRLVSAALVFTTLLASSAWAAAPNCRPSCSNLETSARPTSIMPDPNAFARSGELFTGAAQRLSVAANGAAPISLGFNFTIGSSTFNTAYVNENGALSFGAALPSAQARTASIFTPYITPYQADLTQYDNPTGSPAGGIYVQYGLADPYADSPGNGYDRGDAQTAVRIVWYGTTQDVAATAARSAALPVYAEVILTGDDQGNNSFAFRWGTSSDPSQADYGSRAGFVFYDQQYLYEPEGGSYASDTSPSVFDVANGRVVGQLFPAVPEPATWMSMLAGFALVGWAMQRRPSLGRRRIATFTS